MRKVGGQIAVPTKDITDDEPILFMIMQTAIKTQGGVFFPRQTAKITLPYHWHVRKEGESNERRHRQNLQRNAVLGQEIQNAGRGNRRAGSGSWSSQCGCRQWQVGSRSRETGEEIESCREGTVVLCLRSKSSRLTPRWRWCDITFYRRQGLTTSPKEGLSRFWCYQH